MGDPVAFGIKHHDKIKQLIEIADWATEDWMKVKDNVLEMVQDGDELERYWAYSVACTFGEEVEPDYHKFPDFKNEAVPIVQLSAITLSGRVGATNPMPALIEWLNQSKDPVANLIALNTLVYFKDHTLYGTNFNSDNLQLLAENEEVIRRLKYLDGTW